MKTTDDGAYAFFDGMTWPVPGERLGEAKHRLRHGGATREDVLLAASVMATYRQLVTDKETKRKYVLRNIRRAMSDPARKVTP